MKDEREVVDFLSVLQQDERANTGLIGVYAAILKLWHDSGKKSPFQVSRRKIMKLAHIEIPTYHRKIKELIAYGYIEYNPSYHPRLGSTISIISDVSKQDA